MEHVRAVLDRRESPVSQTPITFIQLDIQKTAAEVTSQVGIGDTQLVAPVGTVSERNNVIEDPVVSRRKLIDFVAGKNMSFGQSEVTSVIRQILIAGVTAGLASEVRQAGRNIDRSLVPTEAGKDLVGGRKGMVNAKIKFIIAVLLARNIDVVRG